MAVNVRTIYGAHQGATRHQANAPPLSITAVKMQVCAFSKAPLPGESGSPPGYITHPPTIPQPTGAGHYRSPASVPSLVGVFIGSGRAGPGAHSSATHAAPTLREAATPLRSGQRPNPSRFLYPPVAPLRGAGKAVG